jgi:predicted nucleic acid-binding protein
MNPLYVETSAILRYLFGEDGADTVKNAIDSSVQVFSSRLTVLEIHRAVIRAVEQANVSGADAERVRGVFSRMVRTWTIFELSADILDRAAKEFPIEPVRSLDAIHLATSLRFIRIFPNMRILSFDNRVLSNAKALGIPVAGEP